VVQRKSIIVSRDVGGELAAHVAGLEGLRRALSLSLDLDPPETLPSFVELWGEELELRRAAAAWPLPARAYLVAEFLPCDYERTWPSGTPSPGVRMVSSLYRRPGTSRRDFEAHWLGPHTVVARSYTVPVWRYSQNVVLEALTGHGGEDGFVGMNFRTRDQLASRWADYPEEAARGAADAALFMDVTRSVGIYASEIVWDPRSAEGSDRATGMRALPLEQG
jgi:hypothetical protein